MFVIAPWVTPLGVCWFVRAASLPDDWGRVSTLSRVTWDHHVAGSDFGHFPQRSVPVLTYGFSRNCRRGPGGRGRDSGAQRLTGRAVRADEVPAANAACHAGHTINAA